MRGDEHDGTEDGADDEPSAGFDTGGPSLGWTVDGFVGNTDECADGCELAEATGTPQNRTQLAGTISTVESQYRGRPVLTGLSEAQRAAMKGRMSDTVRISMD